MSQSDRVTGRTSGRASPSLFICDSKINRQSKRHIHRFSQNGSWLKSWKKLNHTHSLTIKFRIC